MHLGTWPPRVAYSRGLLQPRHLYDYAIFDRHADVIELGLGPAEPSSRGGGKSSSDVFFADGPEGDRMFKANRPFMEQALSRGASRPRAPAAGSRSRGAPGRRPSARRSRAPSTRRSAAARAPSSRWQTAPRSAAASRVTPRARPRPSATRGTTAAKRASCIPSASPRARARASAERGTTRRRLHTASSRPVCGRAAPPPRPATASPRPPVVALWLRERRVPWLLIGTDAVLALPLLSMTGLGREARNRNAARRAALRCPPLPTAAKEQSPWAPEPPERRLTLPTSR